MRWAGRQPLPGGGIGPFALKAQSSLTGGNWVLSGANIELDGNVAEGVLAFATEPRMTVKGTLAADTLDLSPYVSTVEVLRSSERDWNRGTIAIDGLADFDLDLRLSAARVTVATARLGRTGVAANLRDGRLTRRDRRGAGLRRRAQGRRGARQGAETAPTSSRSCSSPTSTSKPASASCSACAGSKARATSSLAVEASGDSVLALTRTLAGTASLSGAAGRHHGLQCRAVAQAAGAAAALDRRRLPPRAHAVRAAQRHAAHRGRHRERRGRAARGRRDPPRRSAARPRSRCATST